MSSRSALLTAALSACLVTAGPALGQGTPAQWLKRIFDPAAHGIALFPGAALNKKLSVDAIQLEHGGTKEIAIYIIPKDKLKAAADYFAKQFGVKPQVTAPNSRFEIFAFDFTGGNKAKPKLSGLRVMISRSEFVDGKGQITMEYLPPKPK